MAQVFVGRDNELEALQRLLEQARTGNGRVALVVGEPGIGKTRLAEELSRWAETRGVATAWGRAWEGGGTPPFWPWRQALRHLLASRFGANIPELVTDLVSERPGRPTGGAERFALYEAVTLALQSVTEETPTLLVLDDMHVADLSSLELLRFIARDLHGARLFVVVTSRELSLYATSDVSTVLSKAAREAMLVPLARLGRSDVVQWLDAAAPDIAGEVDTLFARSDGNPLFVRELIAASKAGGARSTLPTGIRDAIRDHVGLLSPEARSLLEIASIMGREASRASLAALCDPSTELRGLLDEALAKGVVTEGQDGSIRFTHVLVRDELHGGLPSAKRAELHRRAWRTAGDPASALHHALEGGRTEDAAELARTALEAVTEAIARHAFDEAAAMGARAFARVDEGGPPAVLSDLHRVVADALLFAGRRADAIPHCVRAADLAEREGDSERLARAALSAAHEPGMTRRDDVVRLLRRAEAAMPTGDSRLRAVVIGRLARELLPPAPHELEEYTRLRAESIEMARRVGSQEDVFDALQRATEGFTTVLSMDERYALNGEAITLAEQLGRLATIVPLLPYQVACRIQRGDFTGASQEVTRAETILARFQQPHYRWRAPLLRALLCLVEGKFAEADALERKALRAAQDAGDRQGILLFSIQRVMLYYVRGDGDGLDEFAALNADIRAGVPLDTLFTALDHAIVGNREATRACLSRLDPKRLDVIPGVGTLAWACVEAELEEFAPLFIPILEAEQEPFIFGPASLVTIGPVQLGLGRLYLLAGRLAEADNALRNARALVEKLGARAWLVHIDLALAEIELRRDGDTTRAKAARDAALSLGMPRIAARAEALLAKQTTDIAPSERATLRLSREGQVWRLDAGTTHVLLKDTRGVEYLDELLRRPHHAVHVLELVRQDEKGDAGPLLDGPAKSAYRERIGSLRGEIDEATTHNDPARAEKLRAELEAVTHELLRAVGLGGRDRLAGSRSERARSSVQRRLRDVVKRVAEHAPSLGRHLELSVKTGNFCMYAPTWPDD